MVKGILDFGDIRTHNVKSNELPLRILPDVLNFFMFAVLQSMYSSSQNIDKDIKGNNNWKLSIYLSSISQDLCKNRICTRMSVKRIYLVINETSNRNIILSVLGFG